MTRLALYLCLFLGLFSNVTQAARVINSVTLDGQATVTVLSGESVTVQITVTTGTGRLRFYSRGVNPIIVDTVNAVISTDRWTFVSAVHNSLTNTREIYVNGVAQTLTGMVLSVARPLFIVARWKVLVQWLAKYPTYLCPNLSPNLLLPPGHSPTRQLSTIVAIL